MEILKCKSHVATVVSLTDFQREIEDLVADINGLAGMVQTQTKLIGQIPMHLERKNGERVFAQVHITVTIDEDEFIETSVGI